MRNEDTSGWLASDANLSVNLLSWLAGGIRWVMRNTRKESGRSWFSK